MINITYDNDRICVDIPQPLIDAYPDSVNHRKVYILRNKVVFIGLSRDKDFITARLDNNDIYRFDYTGQNGLPVTKIEGLDQVDNETLFEGLAAIIKL